MVKLCSFSVLLYPFAFVAIKPIPSCRQSVPHHPATHHSPLQQTIMASTATIIPPQPLTAHAPIQGEKPFPNIEWSPATQISWPSVPRGVYLGQIKSDQFLGDRTALSGPCNSFSIWNLTKSDVCLSRSLSAATAEEDDYRATKRGAQRWWWWWHLDFGASPLTPIWLLHSTSLSDIKPNEAVQSNLI